MNTGQEHARLLDDILNDGELETLRADLLHRCRAELAAKRRARLRWLVLPAAAAALFVFLRLFDLTGGGPEATGPGDVADGDAPQYVVETVPMTGEQLVSTSSPSVVGDCLVRTAAAGDLAVYTEHQVSRITDSELLAMFPEAPRGLVGAPGGGKRLVFLNPEDETRFRAQAE